MSETPERSLARIEQADIGDVYNGMQGLIVTFAYDEGTHQGLGSYALDAAFVIRFMNAVGGLNKLSDAVGRSVWVTHTWSKVLKVEPLHKKDGRPFDIEEWQEWYKRRMPPMCYREMSTGGPPGEAP